MKKYITNSVFVSLNLCMTVLSCVFLGNLHNVIKVVTVLLFLVLCISIPTINNGIVHKAALALSVLLSCVLIGYIILSVTGFLYIFKDFDVIKEFILSTKQWGILVFLALTVLQVVVLPIPAAVTILIGVAIYGPLWSFVLSTIGTYIGSFISFMLGRTFGKKLAVWLFGSEKTMKYADFLDKKGRGMFIVMLLFPFFPDDLICMIAGLSSMTTKFFLISMGLTRPVMIALTAFLGSGQIIPFKGWGIPVWISIFAAAIIAFIVITFVKNRFAKGKTKKEAPLEEKNGAK